MPHSIPAGMKKEHVLRALAELDAGVTHPFGEPTGYELVHAGKRYAPKAAIGLACRYSIGRVLMPEEFSGGEAPGQANFLLRKLGFSVERKLDEQEPLTGQDWTQEEVSRVVVDYFRMLESEMRGRPYSKAEHRRQLLPQLRGRSAGAVEFKHQNVSGVLVDMGLPYISGYQPSRNYQSMLATQVTAFLEANAGLLDGLASSPVLNPTSFDINTNNSIDTLIEDPPDKIPMPATKSKPWVTRRGFRRDFVARDASNRTLGSLGEQFVFELERHRLRQAGRDDLASRVVWASREYGDGLGFDILSFDETSDAERLVEVKATALGKCFPFYVTDNEVRCSQDVPEHYTLFRVFDFGRTPRLYILHGSLSERCRLDPLLYRAGL